MNNQISLQKIKETIRTHRHDTNIGRGMPQCIYVEIRKIISKSCLESYISFDDYQELNWILGADIREFNRRTPEQKMLVAMVVTELVVKFFNPTIIDIHVFCGMVGE